MALEVASPEIVGFAAVCLTEKARANRIYVVYIPAAFAEDRIEVLHAFLRQQSFATLVTNGADGPEATHVPTIFHAEVGRKGVIRCHVARANRHWESFDGASVLAIFHGPEHYISPSWYPSKEEHGKVVPTWNYAAVHVRGRGRLFRETRELVEHVSELTASQEKNFEKPWSVSDAPLDYIENLTRAIVGVEIAIESIEGKWKMSQNRPEADRRGAVAALMAERK
jgi:transcriptional regulator